MRHALCTLDGIYTAHCTNCTTTLQTAHDIQHRCVVSTLSPANVACRVAVLCGVVPGPLKFFKPSCLSVRLCVCVCVCVCVCTLHCTACMQHTRDCVSRIVHSVCSHTPCMLGTSMLLLIWREKGQKQIFRAQITRLGGP